MKINEIIVEASVLDKLGTAVGKTVGGAAKTVGAVAGGVAGIPGAVKKGFQAGKATVSGEPTAQGGVVQQAPGYQGGVIQPRTAAAQYTKDIASAISTGASGGIYTQGATATAFGKAPVNTKIGQWTKTEAGWVNTTNNKAATSIEADTLDRKWYNETQKQLRQQGARPQTTSGTAAAGAPTWDSKKKLLTVNGQQYKKTAKGWQDLATDELIDPKYAAELNTAFDQASGRAPVAGQTATTAQPVTTAQTTAAPAANIPDVSGLAPEERAELIRQIKQKLGQA